MREPRAGGGRYAVLFKGEKVFLKTCIKTALHNPVVEAMANTSLSSNKTGVLCKHVIANPRIVKINVFVGDALKKAYLWERRKGVDSCVTLTALTSQQ